ncbi:7326_t:CDS:2 [Ambispora leptoticha]|uniref:7326_t:CDS:1 n=1 Tax=Ambispora leptoticha TaxID=144679 RepID=A0A9N9B0R4_9GLOM|nr:7326_t:CDS:2 [Ambispora leptoticha]
MLNPDYKYLVYMRISVRNIIVLILRQNYGDNCEFLKDKLIALTFSKDTLVAESSIF